MTARALPEDPAPCVPTLGPVKLTAIDPANQGKADKLARFVNARAAVMFPGGMVDMLNYVESHPDGTPTTIRNEKLTRPAETYPGEAERMIDTWTRLSMVAIQRARDATTGPRLVSELEDSIHSLQEALRWAKP